MFHNSSNIDASHSAFNDVGRDQYQYNYNNPNIVHGNQTIQSSNSGLENLYKRVATSAAFNSAHRSSPPRCLPGTRLEILKEIFEWADRMTDAGSIFWLYGMAGTGKSAIAQTVAEEYDKQHRLAASFFFSKRESERSDTQRFVPTIVSHIIAFAPAFKPIIAPVFEDDPLVLTKVLREQLTKLILRPLEELKSSFSHPIVIVIDSLDECDGKQLVLELISLLSQLVRACAFLRIFITSRGESHIRRGFTDIDVATVTRRQQLHDYNARSDIQSYFRHTFQEQSVYDFYTPSNPWPSDSQLEALVNQASGLFIYATTVANFINSRGQDPQNNSRLCSHIAQA
ncbi:hypothetical protein BJ138DRAFT_1117506 [Hygrophoropsis aurantiaca]|uniref:Uncharacterized protein n=1 Tax=Hygrophoropsis aurantiaca TaxID=72124 RepID=A0ACB8A0D0_9AGAM|nr:hypothetical protein BJ138DRAFT_1117506 [Hygrophoropsis aurantiaca]